MRKKSDIADYVDKIEQIETQSFIIPLTFLREEERNPGELGGTMTYRAFEVEWSEAGKLPKMLERELMTGGGNYLDSFEYLTDDGDVVKLSTNWDAWLEKKRLDGKIHAWDTNAWDENDSFIRITPYPPSKS